MSVAGSQAVGHAGPSSVAGATAAGDGHGPSPRLPQMAPLSKYKVVFLGDQGTGKTSIIKAFIHGSFDQNYQVRVREYTRAVGTVVACAGAAIGRQPLITLGSTGPPAETAASRALIRVVAQVLRHPLALPLLVRGEALLCEIVARASVTDATHGTTPIGPACRPRSASISCPRRCT
jgi:GTPase SAR1 family protein